MDLRAFNGETVSIIRKTYTNTFDDLYLPQATEELIEVEAMFYYRKGDSIISPYEVKYETVLDIILNKDIEVYPSDIFIIRGEKWQIDSSVKIMAYQQQYDYFLKPPTILTLKQLKGNVKTDGVVSS